MASADALVQARERFERQSWREAHELLTSAEAEQPLSPEDVNRLAACAYMLGRESEAVDLLARAHNEFLARGDAEQAALAAFRIGFALAAKGQMAHGSGWLARSRRVLDDANLDCVVRGYLFIPEGFLLAKAGDISGAHQMFSQAVAVGQRFRDRDLVAFGRQGQGRALIKMGRIADGVALLDEVMVAVTAGELLPTSIGDIYCSVLDACSEIFDLRRAHEWTAALEHWCDAQSDHVPYRGSCLIKRAEILQLHGSWNDALAEVERACEQLLLPPPRSGAGTACYQRGELHRLRGDFEDAEAAYRQASEFGRKPQPGLALLRLAQGDVDAALASIRRCVEESQERAGRCRVLGAFVEILLVANEKAAARTAADELRGIAEAFDAPFLRASAAHWCGAVSLAEGNADEALTALTRALEIWRELEAPYDEGRTRVSIAMASRAVGDDDTAELELDAARSLFHRLGAVGEIKRVEELSREGAPKGSARLTGRELEVLGLVATGKTNRAIADALGLSEKTVARHVANIFMKLWLSTRAAATAYAYQHKLV